MFLCVCSANNVWHFQVAKRFKIDQIYWNHRIVLVALHMGLGWWQFQYLQLLSFYREFYILFKHNCSLHFTLFQFVLLYIFFLCLFVFEININPHISLLCGRFPYYIMQWWSHLTVDLFWVWLLARPHHRLRICDSKWPKSWCGSRTDDLPLLLS